MISIAIKETDHSFGDYQTKYYFIFNKVNHFVFNSVKFNKIADSLGFKDNKIAILLMLDKNTLVFNFQSKILIFVKFKKIYKEKKMSLVRVLHKQNLF